MPQSFQVLKCFKCSVFQVHPIKKSNKWDCKLCGEKQSIKRHYGLGTGKECRLHVQKLNSIRGEITEKNKLEESSEEEFQYDELFSKKKQNYSSKWSDYVDKTEDVIAPEPKFIGNTEVVLEIPAKRRKFHKPTKISPTKLISTAFNTTDSIENIVEFQAPISNVVTSTKNIDKVEVSKVLGNPSDNLVPKPELKVFVPHRVDKTSKWAQFDEDDNNVCENSNSYDVNNDENTPNTDEGLLKNVNETTGTSHKNQATNIFALCDENDLDAVLDF